LKTPPKDKAGGGSSDAAFHQRVVVMKKGIDGFGFKAAFLA